MSTWNQGRQRNLPLIARYLNGNALTNLSIDTYIDELVAEIDVAIGTISTRRMGLAAKQVREWCRTANMRLAHKATKPLETPIGYSASADKRHRGEQTPRTQQTEE